MYCKMYKASPSGGEVKAPPSKSMAHRAILAAALGGECEVRNVVLSNDVKATLDAARALGARYEIKGDSVVFIGTDVAKTAVIDCGESGSTMRFLIPVCAALGVDAVFTGRGKLPERPYDILAEAMSGHGARFDKTAGLPLRVGGRLESGTYVLPGDVSSQYITGLLYALPLVDGDSVIKLASPLQSKGYVDMTLAVLKEFGVEAAETADGYFIKGSQKYRKDSFTVEGDWSNAAFWLVYGALNDGVVVDGLDINSTQGDRAIFDILLGMGADVSFENGKVIVKKSSLKGVSVDVGQIPDLAPILSVAMACAEGKSRLENCGRLRIKESDRLKAISDNLTAVGVKNAVSGDSVEIFGGGGITGGNADGFNDHRIVMSMAVLASRTKNGITVSDMRAVDKSYPDFFEKYKLLGGQADVIDVG